MLQIHPKILVLYLDKNCSKTSANQRDKQCIADILNFKHHTDPQLRGAVSILTASFIKSVLVISNGNYQEWIDENSSLDDLKYFNIDLLLSYICNVNIYTFA